MPGPSLNPRSQQRRCKIQRHIHCSRLAHTLPCYWFTGSHSWFMRSHPFVARGGSGGTLQCGFGTLLIDEVTAMSTTSQIARRRFGSRDGRNDRPSLLEVVARLLGCWHRELSLPMTCEGNTYRVCLRCGARRQFMPDRWMSVGDYYN